MLFLPGPQPAWRRWAGLGGRAGRNHPTSAVFPVSDGPRIFGSVIYMGLWQANAFWSEYVFPNNIDLFGPKCLETFYTSLPHAAYVGETRGVNSIQLQSVRG